MNFKKYFDEYVSCTAQSQLIVNLFQLCKRFSKSVQSATPFSQVQKTSTNFKGKPQLNQANVDYRENEL